MQTMFVFLLIDCSGTCLSSFRHSHFKSGIDFKEKAVAVKIQALGDCRRSTAITPCVVSILFISFKANICTQVRRGLRDVTCCAWFCTIFLE